MNRPITADDYARRLARVAAHVAEHLDEELTLERLAAVANFSPFHFHRLYRELMGETIAAMIRRNRLMRAAGELVQSKARIALVARRAGYGSVAAFTRAFGTAFGCAPAEYRRRGRLVPANPAASKEEEEHMYSVTIRDFPGQRLAALRHVGPYMQIGGTFDRLFALVGARGLVRPETRCLAVYYDDPQTVPAAKLRSDACITVGENAAIEGDLQIIALKPGRCAVARHVGPYSELEAAYRWLYRDWLPASGEEPDDRPCFEEYLNDPRRVPPAELQTDVFLPLKAAR
jgi:AraC family transcriptional regulator